MTKGLSSASFARSEFCGRHIRRLTDGRRTGLFNAACRVAKYIHQGHLTSQEFRAAFLDAARAHGALAKHGQTWADTVLNSAIARAGNDAVPHLAREFRTNGDRP